MRDGRDRGSLGYPVAEYSADNWLSEAGRDLRGLVEPTDVLYVSRLFRGVERAQLSHMASIPAFRLLRIPSTWNRRRYAGGEYRRLIEGGVDAFVVLNDVTYRALSRRHSRKEVHLCFNWSAQRPPAGRGAGFAFSGRLVPSKNVQCLLLAWDALAEKLGPLALITPSETAEPSLLRAAESRTHVRLQNPYQPGNSRVLCEYRFIILPSFREGCPNVLVEAFALGVPVIGTDVPGVGEHIVRVGGRPIRRPFGTQEIAEAVLWYQALSDGEYEEMVRRQRAYAEAHFGSDCVSSLILDHWERLATSGKPRR